MLALTKRKFNARKTIKRIPETPKLFIPYILDVTTNGIMPSIIKDPPNRNMNGVLISV